MSKYRTEAGIECTEEECKLIDSFKRLAKKWKKDGKRLWIYSASGTLHVMMHGDTNYNPTPEFTQYGGSNIENSITIIDGIPNVACEAIVNPNTGKIIDYFDGSFMHAICSNCENEVIISNIEEVKHEIDLRFHEFVERTGKEPEYVECQIVRKETGDEQRKTMKLSLNINDDDNDDVFCYCNGIESFKQLAEYGMGEFIVTFCWSFF